MINEVGTFILQSVQCRKMGSASKRDKEKERWLHQNK